VERGAVRAAFSTASFRDLFSSVCRLTDAQAPTAYLALAVAGDKMEGHQHFHISLLPAHLNERGNDVKRRCVTKTR